MATITRAKIFNNGDVVTPAALHELIDSATIPPLVNADISADAAIADTKLATISTANKVSQSAVTNLTTDLAGKAPATGISPNAITGTAVITTDSRLSNARTPTSHTHGNISNDGKIGTTAHLPVVTGANGVLTSLPAGTAGQVLTSNGGSSAPSFQTLAATSTNANNLTGGSAGTVPYQSAAGTTAMLAAGTSGQVLRSNGTAPPSWTTLAPSATTDTTNAVNITSGTLPNARTTATTANTANAIVARDASGNFSAGTITANITGNLTGEASQVANTSITAGKLNGGQTGSAPIFGCRAWVNFNGTAEANIGGTYSRSGTTVTVDTTAAHGLQAGHVVYLDFTSGAAVDGAFTVATVPSTTQFTVTHGTSGSTSGNVTLLRRAIRASGNVANVTYNNNVGVYTVNFITPLPDANYALAGFANYTTGAVSGLVGGNSTHAPSSVACEIRVSNSTSGAELNVSHVNVLFIR